MQTRGKCISPLPRIAALQPIIENREHYQRKKWSGDHATDKRSGYAAHDVDSLAEEHRQQSS